MMGTWSFFRTDTGEITDTTFTGHERLLTRNTPPGCAPIAGRYDRTTERVDITTGEVVAYERPAAEIEAEQRAARDRRARQRIEQLERSQARVIRELALNGDEKARERLMAIETEIAQLRADLG